MSLRELPARNTRTLGPRLGRTVGDQPQADPAAHHRIRANRAVGSARFARIAHAVGGLAALAGMPDGPPVTPGSTSLGDYLAGLYGQSVC